MACYFKIEFIVIDKITSQQGIEKYVIWLFDFLIMLKSAIDIGIVKYIMKAVIFHSIICKEIAYSKLDTIWYALTSLFMSK